MKQYGKRLHRRYFGWIILLAALIYSGWLCFSGFRNAVSQQIRHFLTAQVQDAAILALDGQEEQTFVHLRRDVNNDITAVTVNGILLSQLQMQYQKALDSAPSQCNLELGLGEILGSRLFSWLPGRVTASCNLETDWKSSVISRTVERSERTTHFQLILITSGTANYFTWFDTNIHEELVLYETMIYTKGT